MDRLTEVDPRNARIIELRFFAGLSVEETGDWKPARAWLLVELSGQP